MSRALVGTLGAEAEGRDAEAKAPASNVRDVSPTIPKWKKMGGRANSRKDPTHPSSCERLFSKYVAWFIEAFYNAEEEFQGQSLCPRQT